MGAAQTPRYTGRLPDVQTLTYALVVASGLVLDTTGALHVYGMEVLIGQRMALVAALLLVGLAAGWVLITLVPLPSPSPTTHPVEPWFLPFLLLLAWLATWHNLGAFLLAGKATWYHLVAGGIGLLLVGALFRPVAVGWLVLCAVVGGSFARIISFTTIPIDPARDDMLPLVQGAITNLLWGVCPYTRYFMPWELPLTYLPATWLAYLPAHLAHLDIRWTNLVAEIGVGAALVWLAATTAQRRQPGTTWTEALKAVWQHERGLLLWAWFFLQPSTLNWSLATTIPVVWLFLCLTLVLVLNQHRLAAVAAGIGLAASPLAVVAVPFVLLYWLHTDGWHTTMKKAVGTACTAACFIVPFLLWSPHEFLYGTWRWFNDNTLYPRLRWDMDNTWAHMVGFSGIFWRRNLVWLLKPIQALLVVGVSACYFVGKAPHRGLAPCIAAAFLLFLMFNPVLWPYLSTPALIAMLVAVLVIT